MLCVSAGLALHWGAQPRALPPPPLALSRLRVSNSWERADISPGIVVWDVSP